MRKHTAAKYPSQAAAGEIATRTKRQTVPGVVIDDEARFTREIYLERRRAERGGRSLLLVLMDGIAIPDTAARAAAFRLIIRNLVDVLRDTDKAGWHRKDSVLGVLLPDLERAGQALIRSIFDKFSCLVEKSLGSALAAKVQVTIHAFPDPFRLSDDTTDFTLYPELPQKPGLLFQAALKRALDFVVSLLALLALFPLLVVVALAIKCSSRGPALFRQVRLGQAGKPFRFLKFRSMYTGSDAEMHEKYVAEFIAGRPGAGTQGIYKITHDPRVTALGRVLRRCSLDELPQLWNVLRGEMSLVGPRPPLPYEFERYASWHRRRILDAKPGMTGLWQVQGRSATTFDDMVRLDLRYARRWSLWLDLKILWHTPAAMLSGRGAY